MTAANLQIVHQMALGYGRITVLLVASCPVNREDKSIQVVVIVDGFEGAFINCFQAKALPRKDLEEFDYLVE